MAKNLDLDPVLDETFEPGVPVPFEAKLRPGERVRYLEIRTEHAETHDPKLPPSDESREKEEWSRDGFDLLETDEILIGETIAADKKPGVDLERPSPHVARIPLHAEPGEGLLQGSLLYRGKLPIRMIVSLRYFC